MTVSAGPRTTSGTLTAYLLLIFAAVTWGGNAVAGRAAVGEVSPMAITCLRWLVVVVALLAFSGRRLLSERHELARHWRALFLMGALGYTGFNALFYVAAYHTSAVSIGLIQGVIPAVVLVGSALFYRTRIGVAQAFGAALALGGVVVAACRGDWDVLRHLSLNVGDLMITIASVLYAGYVLALRRPMPVTQLASFTAMAVAAFLTSLPLLGWEVASGAVHWPTLKGVALLAFIALGPSLLSQLAFMRGVELIGPARAGLFVNVVPIASALLAVSLLGEEFAPYHAVALTMVLGGIGLAEMRRQRV